MHLLYLEYELAALDDIVIEFIPEGYCGEFWAWEIGDGAKVEPIDCPRNDVEDSKGGQTRRCLQD